MGDRWPSLWGKPPQPLPVVPKVNLALPLVQPEVPPEPLAQPGPVPPLN